jgi:hypothetical protein
MRVKDVSVCRKLAQWLYVQITTLIMNVRL